MGRQAFRLSSPRKDKTVGPHASQKRARRGYSRVSLSGERT